MRRTVTFTLALVAALAISTTTVFAVATTEQRGPALLDLWRWRAPLPTGVTMTDLCFTSTSRGWLAGSRGTILRTLDNGANWTVATAGAVGDSDLVAISVVEAGLPLVTRGIAVGEDGATLYTTDGATWREPEAAAFGVEVDFTDVFIAPEDPSKAWVVGQRRSVFGLSGPVMARTTTGGRTWTPVSLPPALQYASKIGGTSATDMWVISNGSVWLRNTGAGWMVRRGLRAGDSDQQVRDIVMQVGGAGYALGSDASYAMGSGERIYRTADYGSTWTTAAVEPDMYFTQLLAVPGAAWARAENGRMYHVSGSAPDTWTAVGEPDYNARYQPHQMFNISSGVRLDVPGSWVKATNDAGATYHNVRTPALTTSRLAAVDFVDAAKGWAVGPPGIVLATGDGGVSWSSQALPVERVFEDVFFIDAERGWVAGDNIGGAHVARTTDGGANWELLDSGKGGTALAFVDEATGWMVGQNGRIRATTDAGSTWTTQTSGTFEALWGVDFTSETNGWACGSGDTLLRTVDGGENWEKMPVTRSGGSINDVDFVDEDRGWCVDSFGGVSRTTDGGATWQRLQTSARGLRSVRFLDDGRTGWVTGYVQRDPQSRARASFTVLETNDGGATWTLPSKGGYVDAAVPGEVWDVDAVSADDAWIVGEGGAILSLRPRARFDGLSVSPTALTFGSKVTIAGRLVVRDASVPGRTVRVEYSRDGGITWTADGLASYDAASETYRAVRAPSTVRTYRLRFAGDSTYPEATSERRAVRVKAALGTPAVPSTIRPSVAFRASGSIKPGHRAGNATKVEVQRQTSSGAYVPYATRTATQVYVTSSSGRYHVDLKLPKGRWRIRATHADSAHARSYSAWRTVQIP